MKKFLFVINAPTPSIHLPGVGYVRKQAGETIILDETQKNLVESPSFPYRDYFTFVEEIFE